MECVADGAPEKVCHQRKGFQYQSKGSQALTDLRAHLMPLAVDSVMEVWIPVC